MRFIIKNEKKTTPFLICIFQLLFRLLYAGEAVIIIDHFTSHCQMLSSLFKSVNAVFALFPALLHVHVEANPLTGTKMMQ